MTLFHIKTEEGFYWKAPGHGHTTCPREAYEYTAEEVEKHRPMFAFWNSHAEPIKQGVPFHDRSYHHR